MGCQMTVTMKETFFSSHGSPMLSIDDSLPARHFLKCFREKIFNQKPNSILVISGHWETSEPTVNFLKYQAPGAPKLAKRVKELLKTSGFKQVHQDNNRGLDHEADIPVCQLSVQTNKDGAYHFNIGKALAPLKEEGVLIVGSGSATHNLRAMSDKAGVTFWAMDFDNWLKESLVNGRYEDVNNYMTKAPVSVTCSNGRSRRKCQS
ncbi:unnamed protein product [Withania somnifera]